MSALQREVDTHPKPGLVSHVDNGAHDDMDRTLLHRSAAVLEPYFADLAAAGAGAAAMDRLRAIGIVAERAMLAETGGVNTHRGAIFGMGLLCAAAGFRQIYAPGGTLGDIVVALWSTDILGGPVELRSHGAEVARKHGAGGARMEAARGFPSLYDHALPALREGVALAEGDAEAARVHACMRLIASVEDANLLYRGGPEGLAFAQAQARSFLDAAGVGNPGWRARALAIHQAFVARRLSPGGCADLLAMALFARDLGE
jgi:triphosphoribosyl-dephospho-CoA synthase